MGSSADDRNAPRRRSPDPRRLARPEGDEVLVSGLLGLNGPVLLLSRGITSPTYWALDALLRGGSWCDFFGLNYWELLPIVLPYAGPDRDVGRSLSISCIAH